MPYTSDKPSLANAYASGVVAAFERFGLEKTAACTEIRKKIAPMRGFHGFEDAFKEAGRGIGQKVADDDNQPLEPQADPNSPVEKLTEMLQALGDPTDPQDPNAKRDPLDRATHWGNPSHIGAGDAGMRDSGAGGLGQSGGLSGVF